MSVRVGGANSPIRILVSNVKSSKSKANLSWSLSQSKDYARSTSLIGSRTTPLSKRTQTSQSETRTTEPMAPAGMLTGGSSAVFSRTWWPTSKIISPRAHSIETFFDCEVQKRLGVRSTPRSGRAAHEATLSATKPLQLEGNLSLLAVPSARPRASWERSFCDKKKTPIRRPGAEFLNTCLFLQATIRPAVELRTVIF
jgi:hypothetical protein